MVLIEQEDWTEAVEESADRFLVQPNSTENLASICDPSYSYGAKRPRDGMVAEDRAVAAASIEDHRNYAAAALSARELVIASAQIDLLLAQQAGPPRKTFCWLGNWQRFAAIAATLSITRSASSGMKGLILANAWAPIC